MDKEQAGRDRLAAAVIADRERLYRSVEKARTAIDPPISRGSWDSVEAARPVKPFTLTAVDQVLHWPAGRARRILSGDQEADLRGEIEASNLSEAAKAHILAALDESDPPTEPRRGVKGA